MGLIELDTKFRGKSKKVVSVYPTTLDKVALGVVLHVVSNCVAVSAHTASHMIDCCMKIAAAQAALCIAGYYATVTAHAMSRTILGMMSQFGCCIQDTAAAVMAAPPRFPEAKSRGLVDLLLLFSFPKGNLKRVFIPFGFCWTT